MKEIFYFKRLKLGWLSCLKKIKYSMYRIKECLNIINNNKWLASRRVFLSSRIDLLKYQTFMHTRTLWLYKNPKKCFICSSHFNLHFVFVFEEVKGLFFSKRVFCQKLMALLTLHFYVYKNSKFTINIILDYH